MSPLDEARRRLLWLLWIHSQRLRRSPSAARLEELLAEDDSHKQAIELTRALGGVWGLELRQPTRREYGFQQLQLQRVCLPGVRVHGVLRLVSLQRSTLCFASLQGARLESARLFRADLRYSQLRGVNLTNASLRRADLRGAFLPHADLTNADLRAANLHGADLRHATLRGANLYGAVLAEVRLRGALYNQETRWPEGFSYATCGAIGPCADLRGHDLRGAHLAGQDLRGADLTGARLRDANLREAMYDRNTRWPEGFDPTSVGAFGPGAVLDQLPARHARRLVGADLQGADLRGQDLRGAILVGADLRGADLRNAVFRTAYLHGANMEGADLSGARLAQAFYDEHTRWPEGFDHRRCGAFGPGADHSGQKVPPAYCIMLDLRGCQMRGTDLTRTSFYATNLQRADFTDAILQSVTFRAANLQGASLRGADLRSADLREARLENADLTGADLHDAQLGGVRFNAATRWPEGFRPPTSA